MADLCECREPGYCRRYGREMRGRFWEICAGINVDIGTAAAFREQWAEEASAAAKQRCENYLSCWYGGGCGR